MSTNNMTGNIDELLAKAGQIACDTIPAGSGGGEGANIVMQIFRDNPGSYFTGKILKKLFEEEGYQIKAVSNILHALAKQGKLVKPQTGVYQLAPQG